ncbi:MAG: hypothetical protein Q7J51_09875 [Sheuella sp.]|nr:hypothetical protein [Sheuella sp.]
MLAFCYEMISGFEVNPKWGLMDPEGTTSEAFDARIRGDLKQWQDLARTNKIVMD